MTSWKILIAATLIAATPNLALAQTDTHSQDANLKVALDLGVPPLAFTTPDGQIAGYSYDISVELAKRLGRPGVDVVDSNFSAIFAGLYANRYEMITSTVNMTPERASQMLFSEAILPAGFAFITQKDATITSEEDLRGKSVAVNNGSVSDIWATENAEKLGLEIQRYNKNADAVQAVVIGRAFAHMGDTPISRYIATQNPRIHVTHTIATGRQYGFAFRPEDAAFRERVELILECMKIDGTIPAIHEKWLGTPPDAGSSAATAAPGNGYEPLAGFEARDAAPSCDAAAG